MFEGLAKFESQGDKPVFDSGRLVTFLKTRVTRTVHQSAGRLPVLIEDDLDD